MYVCVNILIFSQNSALPLFGEKEAPPEGSRAGEVELR